MSNMEELDIHYKRMAAIGDILWERYYEGKIFLSINGILIPHCREIIEHSKFFRMTEKGYKPIEQISFDLFHTEESKNLLKKLESFNCENSMYIKVIGDTYSSRLFFVGLKVNRKLIRFDKWSDTFTIYLEKEIEDKETIESLFNTVIVKKGCTTEEVMEDFSKEVNRQIRNEVFCLLAIVIGIFVVILSISSLFQC